VTVRHRSGDLRQKKILLRQQQKSVIIRRIRVIRVPILRINKLQQFPYIYSMILSSPKELNTIPNKIISLVPSQTELLYHLGLDTSTIAITKFCVHPDEWFKNKTRIGGTKAIDIEKIISLAPDLIIANNEENVKEQVEALAEHFPVWVTDVKDLNDACKMITDIGQLTGKLTEALTLESNIKQEFARLKKIVDANMHFRTAYFIWKDPYMTIGHDTFIHDMMKRAGFDNIFSDTTRYPEVNIQQLKDLDAELILLSSEPYPFAEKHIKELEQQLPGMKILLADGEMFSWYGSRLLQAPAYFTALMRDFLVQKG
jgi:ABC-type Fe3+-hydroxamate transport system substrate-binding protein